MVASGWAWLEPSRQAGADIAIWGRNETKNEAARTELEATGRRVLALACDVADEAQVVAATARTIDELGRIDALFANAGIERVLALRRHEPRRMASRDAREPRWRVPDVAGSGEAHGRAGRRWCARRGVVDLGDPRCTGHGALRGSKAALIAIMRGLAVELARFGVRCNTILPGWTETDMLQPMTVSEKFVSNTVSRTPVRRWGTPDDLGPAAVFLADPTATFHTGDTLVVDGGYTIY